MRDRNLIRELMFRLERLNDPPNIFSISMDADEVQVPGYTHGQIYNHLHQIDRLGYILNGDAGSMNGIGFGGFTDVGYDYLEEQHAKIERELSNSDVPQSVLGEISSAIEELRKHIDTLNASNASKAEISADLNQLGIEIDRPKPRRSFIKLFVESTRDNLAKAGGAGIAGAALLFGGAVARWLHLL